jgi:zinc protease
MRLVSFTNGLELLVHNDVRLKNTVLNLLYKVGSAQEDKTQTGLAHFLEHIMFEGSANFPNFDAELQAMMAENNAFTGQDYTCYYEIFPHRFFKRVASSVQCYSRRV